MSAFEHPTFSHQLQLPLHLKNVFPLLGAGTDDFSLRFQISSSLGLYFSFPLINSLLIMKVSQLSKFGYNLQKNTSRLFTVLPENENWHSHGTVIAGTAKHFLARCTKDLYVLSYLKYHCRGHMSVFMMGSA